VSPAAGVATFGARLTARLDERGPVCVGIDPHPQLLSAWGLPVTAAGLARFAETCVTVLAGTAAVVKPQSAFFEAFGSAGIAVLETTLGGCRDAGALVLLDVKRGDIGSTMAAYARAYLDPAGPLCADAITVNPYLGVGSLQPAFEAAAAYDRGLFVIARTSNPEACQFQRARLADGREVGQTVVDELAARNPGPGDGLGPLGVVVGATIAGDGLDLAGLNGPILAPGVGAQGGTAVDVRRIFAGALPAVLPSVSREVLRHGPDPIAMRAALSELIDQFGFLRK
jgi:orotidine-5'-phosphate decarboxylase